MCYSRGAPYTAARLERSCKPAVDLQICVSVNAIRNGNRNGCKRHRCKVGSGVHGVLELSPNTITTIGRWIRIMHCIQLDFLGLN